MSDKQDLIDNVLRVVVDCCKVDVDGFDIITKDEILGDCRNENACMTRCIFVSQMMFIGFSRSTISALLHRSEKSVDRILKKAHEYRITSYVYRLAEAESTIKLKEIMSQLGHN